MKRFVIAFIVILVVSFAFQPKLHSQAAPGVFADANHPAGAPDPQKLDDVWSVDPINDQVSIKIPFTTTTQGGRGPKIPFSLIYNSASTLTLQASGSVVVGYGSLASAFAWSAHPLAAMGSLSAPSGPWTTSGPYFYSSFSNIPNTTEPNGNGGTRVTANGCSITSPYIYVDQEGASHDSNLLEFTPIEGYDPSLNAWTPPCGPAQSQSSSYWPSSSTSDGSEIVTGSGSATTPDGTNATGNYSIASGGFGGTTTLTDANGNSASLVTVGGVTTATDALGRTVYKTNIPIGQPGQIPAGSYYVYTYDTQGNAEIYTVTFSTYSIGNLSSTTPPSTMSHPTTSEFLSPTFCTSNCTQNYSVSQPSQGDQFTAVNEIDLPDSTSSNKVAYMFSYDPIFGTISKITFPTGGFVQFTWGIRGEDWSPYSQFQAISSIAVTGVDLSDGSAVHHWTYDLESLSSSQATPIGIVHAPDGSKTDYTGVCLTYIAISMYMPQAKKNCKEASRAVYDSSGTNLVKTIAQGFDGQGLPLQVATTLYDGSSSLQQLVSYSRDQWENVTEEDESDYYVCSPCSEPPLPAPSSGWKRITYTSYAYTTNSSMSSAHIVNKPSHVLITDGSGARFSLTDFAYDSKGNLTDQFKCMTISGTGPLPPSDSTPSASCTTYWQTHYVLDATGQITAKYDGYNTVWKTSAKTTYIWTGPDGETNQSGFLTKVTHPNLATDTYKYYGPTGEMASHTDWNNQTTTYSYIDPVTGKPDPLNRIHAITAPQTMDMTAGKNGNGVTTYTYSDIAGAFSVHEQLAVDANTPSTETSKTTNFDGLGRATSIVIAVPSTQCSAGIATTKTTYDSMGRVYSVTNPYCTQSDATYGLTFYQYDALGRKILTTLPDGVASTIKYGGNATEATDPFNGTTNVQHIQQTDGLGRLTDVCEISSTPLGNDASPSACNLNIAGTGYLAHYTYDLLGNLLTVNQHGQSRAFNYDALSRLQCASNPENTTAYCPATPSATWVSGTTGYTYPSPSTNPAIACAPDPTVPCTRTDARGVVTTYSYDDMSRLVSKSYGTTSGSTTQGSISDLSSCYQYDVAVTGFSGVTDTNPLGQLTAEWEQSGTCPSSSVTAIPSGASSIRLRYNHDAMGRVGSDYQCAFAAACTSTAVGGFTYSYNLLGNLVQSNNGIQAGTVSATQVGENYTGSTSPSVTWKTTYDIADNIQQAYVQDQPGTSVWPNSSVGAAFLTDPVLLNPTSYDPFGHMTAAQLGITHAGTTPALTINRQYDVRSRINYELDYGTNASSSPTNSIGTITISGTEQPPAYPKSSYATGSVSVNGTEQYYNADPNYCQSQSCEVPDAGSITITINGVAVSVGYGQPSTVSSLATAMATQINASGVAATAAASGSTVLLTATIPETGGNSITLSASSATSNPNDFPSPSFSLGASGSTLSGGKNAPQVYDSGTVSATINGTTASVSYGQSSTPQSIASMLGTALQSLDGSFLSAKTDGDVEVLVSSSSGTSTDWPISTSVAYDNTDFSSPSFMAISSPSMSNGTAANLVYYYFVPTGGYAPNGNILVHSDMVMGDWYFGYDNVDRLISAAPDATAPSQYLSPNPYSCWSWQYDSYGNRTQEAYAKSPCPGTPTPQTSVSVSTANNHILPASGFVYDSAGNTLFDGWNEYWYDAEGRECAAQNKRIGGQQAFQYMYDPEGGRIAKMGLASPPAAYQIISSGLASSPTCSQATKTGWSNWYLVGEGGEQVTELNTSSGRMAWAHTNVWSRGKLMATYDLKGIHYGLADPLGTKRVQVNATGQVDENCTSLPFGNDVNNPISAQCSAPVNGLQTNDDATEHHFTDKERDAESGNDYFEARYYSSAMGRFLSPDWTAQEEPVPYASLDDPQTLNLYAYVRNNPLTSVDSDGHAFCPGWCDLTGMAFQTQSETEAAERAYNAQAGYGKVTNAQLSQRVAEQRSFLLSLPGLNDATKTQLASAADPIIFHLYMCETASDCGPTRYDPRGILLTGPQVAGAIDPSSIETHHMLPQNETMKSFFEKRGLDVEDFTKDMTAAEHRLKPNGLHTKDGGDWNGVWENWMGKNPNATRAQVLRQLQKMKKDFKIK